MIVNRIRFEFIDFGRPIPTWNLQRAVCADRRIKDYTVITIYMLYRVYIR